ncbi:MAG: virulence factor BrkB family protein [Vibrio metschnikovii]|uniref:virulence factor BrkB family protein n=3 Tax=Vibrionaceae TaxID=641 RepID=UPI0001B948B6|nr:MULTISPECIES: virulence factor BrkB family protein [Vibrio]EEX38030.1 ribonuclease BN [Vibrio metschnikovii CIP 69.14]EKO3565026.1 virulence factor BrkB family protein [Vibrio metschnikovii]EKO3585441.1 virulence factor BrkB family protein [Vibrio metschnikovii]EKO3719665.1 virulence factor BrkB family protein [Vibrio metschnikovii]EKO3770257.1 virulence factor BrkB family protein [Vibrio metschnikovii]
MALEMLFKQSVRFVRYLFNRMNHDRININAGYLAYITLLSLVPMLTVLLSILSSFAIFDNVGEIIQEFVITHFVPAAGDAVSNALLQFVANTGKMTAVGGAFLFIAALMLISNIDKNMNFIWRVRNKRRVVFSFSMYWMILTLGPILVGTSIAVTSYVTSLKLVESEAFSGVFRLFLSRLPFLLSFFAFVGLYVLVPNKKVRLVHALSGAFVAALLFELSKKAFAAYITQFPSYQLIYGALAAIPILFVWVYLCWLIVLIGAEFTAALGESEQWKREPNVVDSTTRLDKLAEKPQGDPSDRFNSTGE